MGLKLGIAGAALVAAGAFMVYQFVGGTPVGMPDAPATGAAPVTPAPAASPTQVQKPKPGAAPEQPSQPNPGNGGNRIIPKEKAGG